MLKLHAQSIKMASLLFVLISPLKGSISIYSQFDKGMSLLFQFRIYRMKTYKLKLKVKTIVENNNLQRKLSLKQRKVMLLFNQDYIQNYLIDLGQYNSQNSRTQNEIKQQKQYQLEQFLLPSISSQLVIILKQIQGDFNQIEKGENYFGVTTKLIMKRTNNIRDDQKQQLMSIASLI
ncbi:unnamed protein product [Paramecium octaurelia]|uniref:Transmembrane protein n=1 Tax=Paramecium octaurelia TaxID=43137 RepID=A0A8S1VUR1_PAROT|nr:unnamed protein product [Paramecium octaurelia]